MDLRTKFVQKSIPSGGRGAPTPWQNTLADGPGWGGVVLGLLNGGPLPVAHELLPTQPFLVEAECPTPPKPMPPIPPRIDVDDAQRGYRA